MTTQLKKAATAVAMAVAFGATAQVAQGAIFFNNLQGLGSGYTDGFQSATNTSNFAETLVTGILTQGAGGNAYDGGGILLGCGSGGASATLNAVCLANSNAGFLYAISKVNFNGFTSAAANSYTLVMKVPVRTWLTSLISPLATLQVTYDHTAAGTGMFEVYANPASQPDFRLGTKFNEGTKILWGTDILDPNLTAGKSAGGNTGTTNTGSVGALNQTGLPSDVDGKVDSITSNGTAKGFFFEVVDGDVAYFPKVAEHVVLGFDLSFNQVTLDAPFEKCAGGVSCDPRPTVNWTQADGTDYTGSLADLFGSDTNGAGHDGGTDGNLLNNFTCGPQTESCGYLGKGQLTASLITPNLPEPGALALMGIGLAGLGAFSRRRRNK